MQCDLTENQYDDLFIFLFYCLFSMNQILGNTTNDLLIYPHVFNIFMQKHVRRTILVISQTVSAEGLDYNFLEKKHKINPKRVPLYPQLLVYLYYCNHC